MPEPTGYRIDYNTLDVWLECPRPQCPRPRVFAIRYPVTLHSLVALAEDHEASCHPDEAPTDWWRGAAERVEAHPA